MARPTIVGAYSDAKNAGTSVSVSVPGVQVGDWLVAGYGVIYETGSISVGGSGAGSWLAIGSQVGSANSPNYQNYVMHAFNKVATGSGTYTVTGSNTSHEQVLEVLHLRDCDSFVGSPFGAAVAQNSANRLVDAGPITANTDDLIIGYYGLVHFGSAQTWTPPTGMTEQLDRSNPNNFNTMECATQFMTSSGSTGVLTATSTMTGSIYGGASKLFSIKGISTPVGPEPGRFLLTC